MQTTDIFEQFARGTGDPGQIGQWLTGAWPVTANGNSAATETKAWTGPLESLLHGAEAFQQLQLDTLHKSQEHASQLARSLQEARNPVDSAKAFQAFAQESMQDALDYWTSYRELAQGAEMPMPGSAGEVRAGKSGKFRRKARARAPQHRHARIA